MKHNLLSRSIFAALTLVGGAALAKPANVDTTKSQVRWVGKKVTGQHNGTLKVKSGSLDVEGKEIKGGSFVIDMNSITVDDIKDPKSNGDLMTHLRSDDFFKVSEFGTAEFKIKSVTPLKNNKDASHEITGDLTIKGITHPLTFPAKIDIGEKMASAKGKALVDRTKYGIKYKSKKFYDKLGDKVIYDDFEVDFDLQANL